MQARYRAKRWMPFSLGSVLMLAGSILTTVAWMVVTGEITPQGRPDPEVGWPLALTGVLLAVFGLLNVVQGLVLGVPPLRLFAEGLVVTTAGASPTVRDAFSTWQPLATELVHAVRNAAAGRGLEGRALFAPWEEVRGAEALGVPGVRTLEIHAGLRPVGGGAATESSITFPQHLFREPLTEIADAVTAVAADPALRATLPPLDPWDDRDRE